MTNSLTTTLVRTKTGKRIDTYTNTDDKSPIKSLYLDQSLGCKDKVEITVKNCE